MGWFVRAPLLKQGETVEWQRPAARQANAFQSQGGRLYLTSTRLIHQPNRLGAVTRGRLWSTQRANIRNVTVEPRRLSIPFLGKAAALRNRLRIELTDGGVQLFVVNHLKIAVAELSTKLGSESAPPGP